MTRKLFIGLVCAALLFASLACEFLSPKKAAVIPTPVVDATQVVLVPTATATEDASATAQAAEEMATATKAAEVKAVTQTASAKDTLSVKQYQDSQSTKVAQQTAEADPMYSVVEQLHKDGILQNTDGIYHRLDDFNENWAQLNWYQWWNTGYKPKDFVVRAHTAWETASKTSNWFNAGCGFVFRAADNDNHYMIFLALDGYVYMRGYVDGKYRELGRERVGGIDHLKGEADVMLAVEGNKAVYYVNGDKVFERANVSELEDGNLGLTLSSGTNKDYGTRCTMTDIDLWSLTAP